VAAIPEVGHTALSPEAACREAVAKSARHALGSILKARASCIKRRMKHNSPASVNCLADPSELGGPGTGDADTDEEIAKIIGWRDRRINAVATGCNGANLAAAGVNGACSPPSNDTAEIAVCAVDVGKSVADSLAAIINVARPASVPPVEPRKCFEIVARALSFNPVALNRVRAECVDAEQELSTNFNCLATVAPPGIVNSTGNAEIDADLSKRAQRWRAKTGGLCDLPNLNTLGFATPMGDPTGAPFTVEDLLQRVYDAILGAAARIDAAILPDEPYCGNGQTTAGEECDDGDRDSCDGCDRDCSLSGCGNGALCSPESCDDGNTTAGDGCSAGCSIESPGCGNGLPDAGEQCDDGAGNSDTLPDACRTDCSLPHCGDAVTDTGEECDPPDGVTCDGSCQALLCGNGLPDPGEQCDDGGESSGCDPDCTLPTCGDGYRNASAGEQCDTGGNTATCDSECTPPVCPDGHTNPAAGEGCDDNNSIDGDGCDSNCKPTGCGNGIVTAGEDCDDGNTTSGDGCSATCSCVGEVGCFQQDPQCPDLGELVLLAGTGRTCSTNGDCGAGTTCNTSIGRCVSVTDLDTGWTGISHDADINDEVLTLGNLVCPGPGPTCGLCYVEGVNPATRTCRCANDTRKICDAPFVVDTGDCGAGIICNCYFGGPLPLSAGNTPACVVNRFASDVSGTANVDTGSGSITAHLRSQVFLGALLHEPCPVCGGTCTAGNVGSTCATELDCETSPGAGDGVCSGYDPTPNDGVRGGTCHLGRNTGLSCDIDSKNTTFPAPGGGGMSLDCFPTNGANVSGAGLKIDITQTTGMQSLPSNVPCGQSGSPRLCPCGECSNDSTAPCTSNADCTAGGTCSSDLGRAVPNQCDGETCSDIGGGNGQCTTGPNDTSCDAIVRANGEGFISCSSNADCDPVNIGLEAGNCSLSKRRRCFLPTIVSNGAASPTTPIGAGVFCIPKTSNGGINSVAGLPGPGRVVNRGRSRTFCASNHGTTYTPGVGGCP
jgi:cysteine-rich repeat protein